MPANVTSKITSEVCGEIRAVMARQGLTQEELSERIGVRQSWVSKRLTGNVRLALVDVDRIARALGVPLSQLLLPPASDRVA